MGYIQSTMTKKIRGGACCWEVLALNGDAIAKILRYVFPRCRTRGTGVVESPGFIG
jgi:hypothetical protein